MYGKEGINALYFYHKTITANTQVGIDEYIKALIQELAKAKIKGLNKTTLTVYELNLIDEIMFYKVGDLWNRVRKNDSTLTEEERKQVTLAGRSLMQDSSGKDTNYEAFYQRMNPSLTKEQQ